MHVCQLFKDKVLVWFYDINYGNKPNTSYSNTNLRQDFHCDIFGDRATGITVTIIISRHKNN